MEALPIEELPMEDLAVGDLTTFRYRANKCVKRGKNDWRREN